MMPHETGNGLADARALVGALRELADVAAPETLLCGALAGAGLADEYAALETALGVVYVAWNAHGLAMVERASDAAGFERRARERLGRPVVRAAAPPAALARALAARVARGRAPRLRFDLRGLGDFERAVLRKALEIPRGEVRPYAWVAREIGRPRAVRAVGTALARNPIPLFIPCHRVVRSDGQIGNYGLGGREAKRAILDAEGVDPDALERLARGGVRYVGSDTTRIYCYPTCRHARRVSAAHRVTFGGEAEAATAGYRPCAICRPLASAS